MKIINFTFLFIFTLFLHGCLTTPEKTDDLVKNIEVKQESKMVLSGTTFNVYSVNIDLMKNANSIRLYFGKYSPDATYVKPSSFNGIRAEYHSNVLVLEGIDTITVAVIDENNNVSTYEKKL